MTDNKKLISRYYDELWNRWDAAALDEIIASDIVFRGSIGTAVKGIEAFRQYVQKIRTAFPDFHNKIEDLIAEGDKVVARLTYTGTHQGEIFGYPGTGARIAYAGIAIFRIRDGKVAEGYVVGDVDGLKLQLVNARATALGKQCGDNAISLATNAEIEWAADVMSTTEPWITLGRTRDQCLAAMRNPAHVLFVAHNAKAQPLGFILLHPEGLAASPYVRSIAVDSASRGSGVGTQLLRFAERLFQGKSRHIFLCVSSFNSKARALYERVGYTKVGEFNEYVISGASELLLHKRLD